MTYYNGYNESRPQTFVVPDPYRSEACVQRHSFHQAAVERERNRPFFNGTSRVKASLLYFCIATFVSYGIVAETVNSYPVWFTVMFAFVLAPIAYVLRPPVSEKLHRIKAKRASREVRAESHTYEAGGRELADLSQMLTSLPRELREELKPLWRSAITACEVLKHEPKDAEMLAHLRARVVSARTVVKEHNAVKAEEARSAARDKSSGARYELDLAGDADLEVASIYIEALREGRERIRELR